MMRSQIFTINLTDDQISTEQKTERDVIAVVRVIHTPGEQTWPTSSRSWCALN
jgi:hypothetical protein